MAKRDVLGRGLASLIPTGELSPETDVPAPSKQSMRGSAQLLSIDLIDPGKYQPRKEFSAESLEELTRSIQEQGILYPLIVRQNNDRYELIAGERRLRAAKAAGFQDVPVIIRTASDIESLEVALVENIQRENLGAIELARAFRQLQEQFGYSQEEISQRVGKDRTTVTNHLRLLRLPDTIIDALNQNIITMGHARALLSLDNQTIQEKAVEIIVEKGLSVRATELLVKKLQQPRKPLPEKKQGTAVSAVQDRLRRTLQTQVKIFQKKSGGGEIRIEYFSADELNRILDLLPDA